MNRMRLILIKISKNLVINTHLEIKPLHSLLMTSITRTRLFKIVSRSGAIRENKKSIAIWPVWRT